jgi:hypothetical protein
MEFVRYVPQTIGVAGALYLIFSLIFALVKKPRNLSKDEDYYISENTLQPRVRPFNKNQLDAILQLHEFKK